MEMSPTSRLCWQELLKQNLNQLSVNEHPLRIAIVGVGNELRGDDAVGVHLVRALESCSELGSNLQLIDAGSAPENITGLLRRFHPSLVMIFDAARMGEVPGTACWLEWEMVASTGPTTHTLPLVVFADYLILELNCKVILVGIQPGNIELGSQMSDEMYTSIEIISSGLSRVLSEFNILAFNCKSTPQRGCPVLERKVVKL
jgi:hydrogenase 3 maturation protease